MANDSRGFLADKLGGRKEPLPPELRWPAMADRFPPPPRRKRRFAAWWWFGGGLGVALLLALGWWVAAPAPVASESVPTAPPVPSQTAPAALAEEIPPSSSNAGSVPAPTAPVASEQNAEPNSQGPEAVTARTSRRRSSAGSPSGTERVPLPLPAVPTLANRPIIPLSGVFPLPSPELRPNTFFLTRTDTVADSPTVFVNPVNRLSPRPIDRLVSNRPALGFGKLPAVMVPPVPESRPRLVYVVRKIPALPFDSTATIASSRPSDADLAAAAERQPVKSMSRPSSFALGGGVVIPDDLDARTLGLPSSYWSATYHRRLSGYGWGLRVGPRWERLVWSSETTFDRPVTLFRPGTVDTIFRNITTGEERIVTTDSIPGIRRTEFRGYGRLTTVSLTLGLEKRWSWGRHRPGLWVSVAPTYVVERAGRFGDPENGLRSLADNELFPDRLWWTAGLGVEYFYRLAPGWSLGVAASVRSTVGERYFGGDAGARVGRLGAGIRLRRRL